MSDAAKIRHVYALRWLNLWTGLVFVLGAAVAAFLVFCIYLLTQGQNLEGAISAIGSLLSGGGFAWVVSRRKEAVKEEKSAYEDLTEANRQASENQSEAERRAEVRKRQEASRAAVSGTRNK